MFRKSLVFLTLLSAVNTALAATAEQWRGRAIYEVVTDRFARADGSTTAACVTADRKFCGGSWRGLINKLDYIKGMGFSAVWISPVVEQIYGTTGVGEAYHGYWPKDYTKLQSNFGTEQDLKDLVAALHARDMYIMVDVVVNHFANWGETINWGQFVPFNDQKYFHKKCWINWQSQPSMEQCWMGSGYVPLPDLNTEDPYVQKTLNDYIGDFVKKYNIDGLRIDAAKNIRQNFWPGFCKSAGVYCQGEVWTNDPKNMCSWQKGVMDGLHNYPMKELATAALSSTKGSLKNLLTNMQSVKQQCQDVGLLGSFMENHDNARMGSLTKDNALLRNMATINVLSGGIPLVYYGQEQILSASGDPNNREALWLTGYPTSGNNLYSLFGQLNKVRAQLIAKDKSYLSGAPSYALMAPNVLAITKGSATTLITNAGAKGAPVQLELKAAAAAEVVEALGCGTAKADRYGRLAVTLRNGQPAVWVPKTTLAGSGICNL